MLFIRDLIFTQLGNQRLIYNLQYWYCRHLSLSIL